MIPINTKVEPVQEFILKFPALCDGLQGMVAEFSPVLYATDLESTAPRLEMPLKLGPMIGKGRGQFTNMQSLLPRDLAKFLKDTPQGLKGNVIRSALQKLHEVPEEQRFAELEGVMQEIRDSGLSPVVKMKLIGDLASEMQDGGYGEGDPFELCLTNLMAVVPCELPRHPNQRAILGVVMERLSSLVFTGDIRELMDLIHEQVELLVNTDYSEAALQLQKYFVGFLQLVLGDEEDETGSLGDLLDAMLIDVGKTVTAGNASDATVGDLFSCICDLLESRSEFVLSDKAEKAFENLLPYARRTGKLHKAASIVRYFGREGVLGALLKDESVLLTVNFSEAVFSAEQLCRVLLRLATISDQNSRVEQMHAFLNGCEDFQPEDDCDAAFFQVFLEVVNGQRALELAAIKGRLEQLRSSEWMVSNTREVVLEVLQQRLRDLSTTGLVNVALEQPSGLLNHKRVRHEDSP